MAWLPTTDSAATPELAAEAATVSRSMPAALRLAATQSMARYADPRYRIGRDGHGANPHHGLVLSFTPQGALLAGRDGAFALGLERFGRGDGEPVRHAKPRIDGAWVEYDRGSGVREWFVNLPRGLEQGWTVGKRPAGGGPLVLELDTAHSSDHVEDDRPAGSALVHNELVALDAEGQELRSQWVHDGTDLRIQVDDTAATYPVAIGPLTHPWVWGEEAVLAAADGTADRFGSSVALLGDTALVGAPNTTIDGNTWQGAAYVFTRSGDTWKEQAKLIASDGSEEHFFGRSVALSSDTAVVGAQFAGPGAVYVFSRDGDVWSEQAKLMASDGGPDRDQFGYSVALFENTVLVGAQTTDIGEITDQGAAYVFTRSGDTWNEQEKLTASDGAVGDLFGISVAIADDTALVGASYADIDGSTDQGAAYVFVRDGDAWSEQAKLIASDGVGGNPFVADNFGHSVAFSGDTALIGAPFKQGTPDLWQGAVYVFVRTDEIWQEQTKLTASDGASETWFGLAVDISGDTAIVGTPATFPSSGTAYILIRDGETWSEQSRLRAFDEGEHNIGFAVALSGDTVLAGDTFGESAHVFSRTGIPIVDIVPESFSHTLPQGQTETHSLTIGNLGAMTLTWEITEAADFFEYIPRNPGPNDLSASVAAPAAGSTFRADVAGANRSVAASSGTEATVDLVSVLGESVPGLRPIAPTGAVIDCDAEPGIIVHDDGTIENGYLGYIADLSSTVTWVDRFTPSAYPASFSAVCISLVSLGTASLDFEIVLFDDDGPGGRPGTELGAMAATATDIPEFPVTDPVWFSYDISLLGIAIDSGSVYIGARWATPADPVDAVFISADESTGNPVGFASGWWWSESFNVWTAAWAANQSYRSLFVRALGENTTCDEPGTVPWLSIEPASGSTPVGETSVAGLTLDAAGLPPGSYEANLCIGSDDPTRPLIVVPVELTVVEALPAELMFDPPSLEFGAIEVGDTSAPQTATLQNTGDLNVTGLLFSMLESDFEADTSACGETLPVGGSCEVGVTFTPAEPGSAEAALHVGSNEDASAGLALTGNGEPKSEVFTPMALEVDTEELLSDGNDVLEPGELVEVAPAWRNDGLFAQSLTSATTGFHGPDGAIYALAMEDADYGNVEPGAAASCLDTGVCFWLGVNDPVARPATHWMATFDETLSDDTTKTWSLHIGDSFTDVPRTSPFYPSIETLLHHGVTGGCTGTEYCPAGGNTRGQMAVFLLKAAEGGNYAPPACAEGEELFTDVPFDSPFCPWIEELAGRQVTSGCGNGNYCPGSPVTRAQMSVFLLRAFEGGGYTPPECTGEFSDLPCTSTFAAWVEELAERGITSGCAADPPAYCPAAPVTRDQMAVFVTKTFGLTLYGP